MLNVECRFETGGLVRPVPAHNTMPPSRKNKQRVGWQKRIKSCCFLCCNEQLRPATPLQLSLISLPQCA
jgi:hypothetical protein